MEDSKRRRRRHDAELKSKVLSACEGPGASVAQVALQHGLNANLVHKWRRESGGSRAAVATTFIPLSLRSSPTPVSGDIHLELRRGAVTVNVRWPLAAARESALWLREFLK